jgi:hypothetical protein
MNLVLALVAVVVGANAVLGLVLVVRYRREQPVTDDDHLARVVRSWQAAAGRGPADSGRSAA